MTGCENPQSTQCPLDNLILQEPSFSALEDCKRNFSCLSNIQFLCILTNSDVLVSRGCHNKVPQNEWLKTTGIYCLTVLQNRSLKLRCQQGYVSSVACKKESFFPLLPLVIRNHWYSLVQKCTMLVSLPLSYCGCILYMFVPEFPLSYQAPSFTESIKVYPNINKIMCKTPIL